MAELYIALEDRTEYNLAEDVYSDPSDVFLGSNLWRERRHTNVDLLKAAEAKDVDRYVRLAGGLDQALLRIVMEKDITNFPEGKIILFVIELLRRGAKVNCTNARGDMPLHLSAMRGFVELARELRKWGAEPNVVNSNGHTPMEMAIHLGLGGAEDIVEMYNVFATYMIKEMEPSRVRECFLSEPDNPARLSFHKLLNHPDMKETVQAVLDCLIERVPGRKTTYTVHYSILETDKDGTVLASKSGLAVKRTTVFEEIAWKCNKEAVTHLSVLLLIQSKWRRFARISFILYFLHWVLLMSTLACALVLAASREDPRVYDQPLDVFRGCCEGLSILLLTLAVICEVYNVFLWRMKYFKQFSFFVYNYLNILTTIFVVVLIPLRITDSDIQWVFASLAYVSYSLRVFKYFQAIPVLSKYLKILYQVLIRDLIPFLLVSLAVTFVFTGAFYFALREEILVSMLSGPSSNVATLGNSSLSEQLNTNQTMELRTSLDINPEETGTYPRVFLTGVRLIIEGQNFLTYFGISGYRVLGVLTYILFLFVFQVILLNLLIAQMADTYSSVQEDAQRELIIDQTRNIASIERSGLSTLRCITDFFIREESWKNPKSHVHKINQKSLVTIDANTKLIRRVLNHHSLLLEEMRDGISDQKMSLNQRIENIIEQTKVASEAGIKKLE